MRLVGTRSVVLARVVCLIWALLVGTALLTVIFVPQVPAPVAEGQQAVPAKGAAP
jgi:hypothetical protein